MPEGCPLVAKPRALGQHQRGWMGQQIIYDVCAELNGKKGLNTCDTTKTTVDHPETSDYRIDEA